MTYFIAYANIVDRSKKDNKCPKAQLQSLKGAFEIAVRALAGVDIDKASYQLGDYRIDPEESVKDYVLTVYRESEANMQEKWWGTFKRNARVIRACAIATKS